MTGNVYLYFNVVVAPQTPCHSQPMSWLRDDSCPTRVWTETVDVVMLGRDARRMFLRGPSRNTYRSTTPSRHPGPVEVTTSRRITATASLTMGTAGKIMLLCCYLILIPYWPLQSNSAGSNQLGTLNCLKTMRESVFGKRVPIT